MFSIICKTELQEEQGAIGGGAALESACAGAANAASELERALVAAARDHARELVPLVEEARRWASDLRYTGKLFTYNNIMISM